MASDESLKERVGDAIADGTTKVVESLEKAAVGTKEELTALARETRSLFRALAHRTSTLDASKHVMADHLARVNAADFHRRRDLPSGGVLTVAASDSLEVALKLIIDHGVTAVGVTNESGACNAWLSAIDIVAAIVMICRDARFMQADAADLVRAFGDWNVSQTQLDFTKIVSEEAIFKATLVSDIINLSQRNPFVTLPHTVSLFDALKLMVQKRLHRLALVGEDGKVVSVVTLSQAATYLLHRDDTLKSLLDIDMRQLHAGQEPLTTVKGSPRMSALECFRIMSDAKISGMPIADEHDVMLGSLSARDLHAIGLDGSNFSNVYLPVLEFIKLAQAAHIPGRAARSSEGYVVFSQSETLRELLGKMITFGTHRAYRMSGKKVVEVFSLSRLFAELIGEEEPEAAAPAAPAADAASS